jgi:hypothetical protein
VKTLVGFEIFVDFVRSNEQFFVGYFITAPTKNCTTKRTKSTKISKSTNVFTDKNLSILTTLHATTLLSDLPLSCLTLCIFNKKNIIF